MKKKHLILFMVVFITIFCIFKCEKIKKPGIINENKFAKIYTEYIVVADTTTEQLREVVLDSTLKRFGEEKDKFYRTLQYYREKPLKWEGFLQKVIKNLEEKQRVILN